MAKGNAWFFALCLCAGCLTGSLISVYTIGGVLIGILQILRGFVPLPSNKAVMATSLAFAAFFGSELLASLVNPGGDALQKIGSNTLFLGLLPLSALLVVNRKHLVDVTEKSAAFFGIAGAVIAILLPVPIEGRMELAAGNAGILAVLAGILYVINTIAFFRAGQSYWRYAMAGMIGAAIMILLSGMRALWPCLVLIPIVTFVCFTGRSFDRVVFTKLLGILCGVGLLALIFSETIVERFAAAQQNIEQMTQNNLSSSLGYRVVMWKGSAEMISKQPLLGYGPGNVESQIKQVFVNAGLPAAGFSHFHNVMINELMRAGIVGLVALMSMFAVPLYCVYRAEENGFRSVALAMIIGTQSVFLLSGATGIMFGHDIMDALFLSAMAYVLYLIKTADEARLV